MVRQAQANVAANDPWASMIVTDDISRQDDDLHYDEAGHIDFGQRLGNAYLELTAVPEPACFQLLVAALLGTLSLRRRR